MTRRSALVSAVLLSGLAACIGDTPKPPDGGRARIFNYLDEPVTFTYEVPAAELGERDPIRVVVEPDGLKSRLLVPRDDHGCLVGPFVGRTPDGTEVARFPEGHCLGDSSGDPENTIRAGP